MPLGADRRGRAGDGRGRNAGAGGFRRRLRRLDCACAGGGFGRAQSGAKPRRAAARLRPRRALKAGLARQGDLAERRHRRGGGGAAAIAFCRRRDGGAGGDARSAFLAETAAALAGDEVDRVAARREAAARFLPYLRRQIEAGEDPRRAASPLSGLAWATAGAKKIRAQIAAADIDGLEKSFLGGGV